MDEKEVLKKLQASETAYRTLAENIPDIIYRVQLQGCGLQFFNNRIFDITGYSADDLRSGEICSLESRIVDEDREQVVALVKKAIRDRSTFEVEYRFRHRNGTIITLLERGAVVCDESDMPLFIDGVIRDITERKRAEEVLRASEIRTRSIVESIPIGMHMYCLETDDRLVFTGANPAADRILGVDNSTFIGKTIEEAFPALKATEVPQRYREAAATGKNWRTEQINYNEGAIQGAFEVHAFQAGPNAMVAAFEDITERKRTEAALKANEAKYRRLYNETPVLLHSIDREAVLVDVNDYWLKTLGYERREAIGKKATDFYTEASRKYAQEVVQPAFFRDGMVKEVSYQFVKKNGEVIDVVLSATAERDSAGKVIRSQAVIEEVTERKRAEKALQESQARFQALFEQSNDGVTVADREGRYVLVNPAFCAMTGYCREELLNMRVQDLLPGNVDSPLFRQVVSEKRAGHREGELKRKDGSTFLVSVSGTILQIGADQFVHGIVQDITDRKRADEALRESEQRFRDLAETLPLTVFEIDLQARFTYVNTIALQTFGYAQQDIDAGMFMPQVIAPEDRDRAREAMSRRLAGQQDGYLEYQGLRKDGTTFPITVASGPIVRNGRPAGLRGIVTDISERKQWEQEMLKAQKLESIGTLAGGIAHDFNNLLQGVFGYISLAKLSVNQPSKSIAALEQAEKALHQSVSLTSQLLTFSKGGKPVKRTIALGPVIENAARFALSGSRVAFELSLADGLRSVEADAGQIGQVVQNIVLNADQAMPLGGRIELAARNVPAASLAGLPADLQGDLVEITIKDGGTGIPPEHLARIFDPYFTTKEKGSGLGLATSYSIIGNHGGAISVTSELGKGSTFTVYLPASTAKPEPTSGSGACVMGRSCRILVMDDDAVVRDVAAALLAELGHEVEIARHGEEAIEIYRTAKESGKPFDIVILDLTVRGGMGGVATIKKLRELDPKVIAVASSGYSDDAGTSTYQQHGFRAFLSKPYSIEGLNSMLRQLLP